MAGGRARSDRRSSRRDGPLTDSTGAIDLAVRQRSVAPPTTPTGVPLILTVGEAAAVLRISRTSAYKLAHEWRTTRGASRSADGAPRRPDHVRRVDMADIVGLELTNRPLKERCTAGIGSGCPSRNEAVIARRPRGLFQGQTCGRQRSPQSDAFRRAGWLASMDAAAARVACSSRVRWPTRQRPRPWRPLPFDGHVLASPACVVRAGVSGELDRRCHCVESSGVPRPLQD